MSKKNAIIITVEIFGCKLGSGMRLDEKGYDCTVIKAPRPIPKWNIPIRLLIRAGINVDWYINLRFNRFSRKVKKICDECRPEILYVFLGDYMKPFAIDEIKKYCFTAIYLTDRLSAFPETEEYSSHYDMVYTYSKEDADHLNGKGVLCQYVPAPPNTEIFYPKELKRDIDISFVGELRRAYVERREFLTRLVYDFPDANIEIYGEYAPLRRPLDFFKWVTDKRLRKCFKNRYIPVEKAAELYNRTKVCVNINCYNIGNGWSDRLANIAAAKSFQLVSYNEIIDGNFKGMVDTFKDYEELKQKTAFYLENEKLREEMAERMYESFLAEFRDNGFDECEDIKIRAEKKIADLSRK